MFEKLKKLWSYCHVPVPPVNRDNTPTYRIPRKVTQEERDVARGDRIVRKWKANHKIWLAKKAEEAKINER